MALTVTPLHPHIGAEIDGLDLREPGGRDDGARGSGGRSIAGRCWCFATSTWPTRTQRIRRAFRTAGNRGAERCRAGVGGLSIPEIGDISNLDVDSKHPHP